MDDICYDVWDVCYLMGVVLLFVWVDDGMFDLLWLFSECVFDVLSVQFYGVRLHELSQTSIL